MTSDMGGSADVAAGSVQRVEAFGELFNPWGQSNFLSVDTGYTPLRESIQITLFAVIWCIPSAEQVEGRLWP